MKLVSPILALLLVASVTRSWGAAEFKEADITTVKNMVEHDPGTGAAPAKVNDKIKENSKVSTAAASMAELTFTDSSITRMGANTQFSFQSKERLVKLEQGTVLIHTPPGNGGATVDCGGVTGAVSGTTFMASRDAAGNVMFVLLEGQGGLKVTVGGAAAVLRPGQAASVGADVVKESKDTGSIDPRPGAAKTGAMGGSEDKQSGGSGQTAAPSADKGDGPASASPKIQVFEVDVKKVVSTTPLIVEFKTELPSAAKIEKTVEVQQAAIKEGKFEKLDVEVVAVKSKDGDVMVGAPKVQKEEMVVRNGKGTREGPEGDLDIATAAGPGAGNERSAAPLPSRETPMVAAQPASPLSPIDPGLIGSRGQPTPPSALKLVLGSASGSINLNRPLLAAQTAKFSGLPFPDVAMAAGSSTASFSFDPQEYFFGFDAGMNLVTSRAVGVTLDNLGGSALFSHDLAAVQRANPVRRFLYGSPSAADMTAFDAFFYFKSKADGVIDGPDRFFADASAGGTDRTLAAPGRPVQLFGAQNFDLFAAGRLTAGAGIVTLPSPSAGKTESVFYATTMDLGAANPRWVGTTDPQLNSASLGSLYLSQNPAYRPVFLPLIDPANREPIGFTDLFGALIFPLQNFPIWDDEGGFISSVDRIKVDVAAGSENWTLAAGDGGLAARGLEVSANGAGIQLLTSGDLDLKTSVIRGVAPLITGTGPGTGTGTGRETLTVEARGKVRMGTDAAVDLNIDTNSGLAEEQQVRLEAATDASGNSLSGNMVVVRTGDSLELRNVTIRGFSDTSLEKINPTTKALEGRVLISGSAVRDFKIKELVGAAVNADSKIQMMALDAGGQLAGDMVVEGKLPVQAEMASALAAVGEALPSATAGTMVDAQQIDLAARNLKFENANLAAMNTLTARANTILIQNSFMTVVRNQGMINMYVQSGLVNTAYGSTVEGRVNFAGLSRFQIGNNYFEIGNQDQLTANYGSNVVDITQNGNSPQAGKLNVLKL